MYIHMQWNSKDLAARVFYAPKAIKNVILLRFNKIIDKDQDLLLTYENNNWQGASRVGSFTNREFLSQLLEKLKNVVRLVQVPQAV